MNKRMLAVALLTALVVFCLTLVACNPAHEHDFETEWSYNETEHWHKCKGCDEVADKAAHHGGKLVPTRLFAKIAVSPTVNSEITIGANGNKPKRLPARKKAPKRAFAKTMPNTPKRVKLK